MLRAQVYARNEGTALRNARERKRWSQSKLARRAQTSSATISTLEGIIGRSVSLKLAEQIAHALALSLSDLFTAEPPPANRIGQRSRPATRPQDRYDGARAKAEADRWQRYLARVRASEAAIYEWGRPLSAQRATARFGLNPHTLAAAARDGRVRTSLASTSHTTVQYEFDEAELAEDLAALTCRVADCDRIALGASCACEEHGHVLVWTGQRHTPEARARISAGKRGKGRPDTTQRLLQRHAGIRQNVQDLKAKTGFLTVPDVAARFGIKRGTVIAHYVKRGQLPGRRYNIDGHGILFFEPEAVEQFSYTGRGATGRMAWELRPPAGTRPNRAFALARLKMDDVDPNVRRVWKARFEGWRGRDWMLDHPDQKLAGPGRRSLATPAQEQMIARLKQKGWPNTDIAQRVFDDPRREDRVRRVLHRLYRGPDLLETGPEGRQDLKPGKPPVCRRESDAEVTKCVE